ncbi:acyl-CoA synthetase [Alkalispirochaeta sphaeroplastigenens]|uniref:Acyl-CoA synthetase n=1 Tax=Alkalispirochaeta sphaeroplastigenens TaxID=1187066 RepID=A0A2S4K126_9SPIO|nr:AMP-binding protein [Alkalispirochaeta sphaeroplastigenens]POR05472.1 acyl-CoA synthetase [Alkalispirochaeta sphaeroplastigenens]
MAFNFFRKSTGASRRGNSPQEDARQEPPGAPGPRGFRLIFNPSGDAADILAYATGLAEGRIAGKYMLSKDQLPDTVVIQGVSRKGIIAGADLSVDQEAAKREEIDVARQPRSGRSGAQPVDTVSLGALMTGASDSFTAEQVEMDQPAVLLYTSGTTGKPKGVMLSHANFYAQCSQVVPSVMEMRTEDRVVLVLPLFHVYGLSNGLVASVFNGCSMALVSHYSPANLLATITEQEATLLIAIPTMYQHLLQSARVRKQTIPKSLRGCISGGAPLAVATIQEFEELFQTRINEGYGLTETTSAVSLNPSGEAYKEGSIGPPAGSIEMAIMDEEGSLLPDNQEGEIVIRGPVVTQGYWNNREATDEAIHHGWFHTGDLGYRDGDGYYFITDRKKDLIIRGGFNISPREVEETIATHQAVQESAVVAVRDKRGREAVKAFVVLKEAGSLTQGELSEFCTAHLAPYKVPKLFEFVQALPKSAAGKVLRRELRGEAQDDRLINREDSSHV